MNAATFGPSGNASRAATYSSKFVHVLVLVDGADDVFAGDRLDPGERSPASTPPTCTVGSEHDPSITVVTPCRSDSDSDGPLSTSTS